MKSYHVLLSCDGPGKLEEACLKQVFQDFVEIGEKVSWPTERNVGGEHHFIILLCDDRDAETSKKFAMAIFKATEQRLQLAASRSQPVPGSEEELRQQVAAEAARAKR